MIDSQIFDLDWETNASLGVLQLEMQEIRMKTTSVSECNEIPATVTLQK